MANSLDSQTSSKISLSLSRSLPLPLPPPRPVWLSPPHPPPRRKAPKAVNDDLYRISPELLLAKHRIVYGTGLTEIEIGGEQRSGIKVDEVRKSSNSVHDKGFNFDDARLMRGAWWSEPNPDMCKMTKLAIIPCTVLLETIFFRKKFSRNIQLLLTILLLGVGIATMTDLQLNVLGSVLSLLAVVTTCVAQIMTNTIQKKFKVSSTQLLYQSCPYQAITLFITGPFVDGLLKNLNVFAFKYTPQVLAFIVLSCLISVSVNFSTFLVIGKTSPVTYQVLGHLKTCLVLAFGYGLLHDPFSWRNILGILFALVGMILYSYCCTLESQQKANEAFVQLSQAKESESEPLMSVENGASVLADSVVSKSPAWSSNTDLHA